MITLRFKDETMITFPCEYETVKDKVMKDYTIDKSDKALWGGLGISPLTKGEFDEWAMLDKELEKTLPVSEKELFAKVWTNTRAVCLSHIPVMNGMRALRDDIVKGRWFAYESYDRLGDEWLAVCWSAMHHSNLSRHVIKYFDTLTDKLTGDDEDNPDCTEAGKLFAHLNCDKVIELDGEILCRYKADSMAPEKFE